jgi:hypothetical protein
MAFTAEYLTNFSFRMTGSYTAEFMQGRRVRAYCGMDGYRYGLIENVTFSNPYTTVYFTSTSEELTNNLEYVEYGIIGYGSNQSMPYHDHSGDSYSGGIIESDLKSYTPHGFSNRADSVLTYDSTSNTIILTPTFSSFDVYVRGVKFTFTTTQSVSIPSTTGLYGVIVDENGIMQIVLNISQTNFILNNAQVALAYWNNDSEELIAFADERHTVGMSGPVHYYLHRVFRTKWLAGLSLGNIQEDQAGDFDSHCQFSVSNGEFADEDLTYAVTNNFPQALAPIAYIPVFYRSGASGIWNKNISTSFPVMSYGSGRLAYNQFTGGSWTQTEVDEGQFVLAHIYAFNDYLGKIISVQGQSTYATVEEARIGAELELTNINLSGLPLAEILPIGSVIYQTSSSYTNTVKARIRSTDTGGKYVDWRYTPLSSIGSSNVHSTLAGLNSDDHHQYILVDGTRAFTGTVSGVLPTLNSHLATKEYVDPTLRVVTTSADAYARDLILVQTVDPTTMTLHHSTGAIITVKKCDTGAVTLQPSSGNIDGSSSITLTVLNEKITVVWDGNNWFSI